MTKENPEASAPAEVPAVPATEKTEAPVAEKPATEAPAAPAAETPATDAPTAPAAETPATDAPTSSEKGKKKSKVPLIIGISLLAAGCIAGATVALMNTVFKPKGGTVSTAISKLLSGETPKKINLSGTFNGAVGGAIGESLPISSVKLGFESKIDLEAKGSDTTANVTANLTNGSSLDFQLYNIIVPGGDIYIKLGGISEIVSAASSLSSDSTGVKCIKDASDPTKCGNSDSLSNGLFGDDSGSSSYRDLTIAIGLLSLVDNQWIGIPASAASDLKSSALVDNKTQCMVSAFTNLTDYGKDLSELYNKNQFIISSTDNITVAKVKDEIYRLSVDNEKLAGFINGLTSSSFYNDLLACNGGATSEEKVTAEMIGELFKDFPGVYAEIDGNNNFTRLYFDTTKDGSSVTADLRISYPDSITISAPAESKDITELISSLFNSVMGGGSSASGLNFNSSLQLTF